MVISKKIIVAALAAIVSMGALVSAPVFATDSSRDAGCIDGTVNKNYTAKWTDRSTLHFKANGKLCEDVTLYFSSYTMPDNYDGTGFFGNPTAYPQYIFASKKIELKAGTVGEGTVSIAIPNECKNLQIDLYIGPEITVVNSDGHQGRAIKTRIIRKTKDNCDIHEEKKVQVCDPKTGKIITVYESDAHNYLPKDDPACKPKEGKVQVCDPKTGKIIWVKESEADNYLPKGDEACKPKVQVCNPKTGKIIWVKPSEVKNYKPVTDDACKNETVQVCNPATGQIISVKPSEVKNYKPVTDDACKPKVLGDNTPEEIASTGPAGTLAATLGLGTLAGATMYLRNFRRQ